MDDYSYFVRWLRALFAFAIVCGGIFIGWVMVYGIRYTIAQEAKQMANWDECRSLYGQEKDIKNVSLICQYAFK